MALTVLTKNQWNSFTQHQRNEYRKQLFISRSKTSDPWPFEAGDDEESFGRALFAYYRVVGFPYYELDEQEQAKKFKSLIQYDHSNVIRENEVHQTMHGLSIAWTYFHHMWNVQCNNMRTPYSVFHDDTLFMKAIMKRLKWGTYISDSGIRKALRSFTGTQAVSNFRPTAAAAIYHHFLPESGGVTWDMSSGFGGRLLGAMICSRVQKYIGTDPSTYTMDGLQKMREDLLPMLYAMKERSPLSIELHKCGSEDYKPEPESIDLCFTSPPYFDCEKYSEELTQSYKRFPSQDAWLNGFMRQTLRNCHVGLKSTGYLVVNIAGVKSYPTLHDEFVAMAESVGFRLESKAHLLLSRMMGTRTADNGKYKMEPIFVFKKLQPA